MSSVAKHIETANQQVSPEQNQISTLDIVLFFVRFVIFFTLTKYISKKNKDKKSTTAKTYPIYDPLLALATSRGV
jgi:hypothetical protein